MINLKKAKIKIFNISKRKADHVNICLHQDVQYKPKHPNFDDVEFQHNSLPELNYKEIDVSTSFLGRKISFPLMISCMTGGYDKGNRINQKLAEVGASLNIPVGVGSQRILFEKPNEEKNFRELRRIAPRGILIGNIGAVQIANIKKIDSITRIIDSIEADALAIHLNPLQELLQPEGELNFKGVINGIEFLLDNLNLPLIIKETGAGFSKASLKKLIKIGVKYIDLAGAEGTSWGAVELLRDKSKEHLSYFRDWGATTVESLVQATILIKSKKLTLISSGGIDDGIRIAKSVALGADLASSARPILKSLINSEVEGTINLLNKWRDQLKSVMFLTGAENIAKLMKVKTKINQF